MNTLIEKLGSESSDEDNLNANSILQEALDNKEFYHIVATKVNLSKLFGYVVTSVNETGA